MAYLAIHEEGKPIVRQMLDDAKPLVLGRAPEADLYIDDPRLSRQHCRFARSSTERGATWSVVDLNSTNGTHVRGQRIGSQRLHDGDEIIIGRTRIVFHRGRIPKPRPKDPHESMSGVAAASRDPSETLVDSEIVGSTELPSPQPQPPPPADDELAAPLAFRRPPAQPIVSRAEEHDLPRRGWLRALFRKRPARRSMENE